MSNVINFPDQNAQINSALARAKAQMDLINAEVADLKRELDDDNAAPRTPEEYLASAEPCYWLASFEAYGIGTVNKLVRSRKEAIQSLRHILFDHYISTGCEHEDRQDEEIMKEKAFLATATMTEMWRWLTKQEHGATCGYTHLQVNHEKFV